jgi:hypothetical protein
MNAYRHLMAMAVTICAADLPPAACTAGRRYKARSPRCPTRRAVFHRSFPRQRAQQHRQELLHDYADAAR